MLYEKFDDDRFYVAIGFGDSLSIRMLASEARTVIEDQQGKTIEEIKAEQMMRWTAMEGAQSAPSCSDF